MNKPIGVIVASLVLCLWAAGRLEAQEKKSGVGGGLRGKPGPGRQLPGGRTAHLETSADPSFNPEKIPKLAVIVFGPQHRNRGQTDSERCVEDVFVGVLMRKGYSVVSRSDLQSVFEEQRFQKSGLTESDAAAIGKILNVPAVMVVKVTDMSTVSKRLPANRSVTEATAGMGVRVISVENASVLWIGTFRQSRIVNSKSDVSEVLADVAKRIASAFPPQKSPKESTETKPGSGKADSDAPDNGPVKPGE